eukprot:1822686-Ditylum_brightwellii.AAC.1
MRQTVRKLTNRKAPGMDQVQNYWYKHMPALHQRFCDARNDVFLHPDKPPEWLLCDLTTLIHKKGHKNIPKTTDQSPVYLHCIMLSPSSLPTGCTTI